MVSIKVGDGKHYGTITEILNKVFGIPEFFEKSFTKSKVAAKEQAVFMRMKDPQTSQSRYFFYGVFTAKLLKTASRICIYTRKSAALNPAEWI